MEITEKLKKNELFSNIPECDLSGFQSFVTLKSVKKDAVIFVEGDHPDSLYLVFKGRVGVFMKVGDKPDVLVTEIKEDSFFGEIAFLEQNKRSATAIATEDSELGMISHEGFQDLIARNRPEFFVNLMKQLSGYLRDLDNNFRAIAEERMREDAEKITRMDALIETLKLLNSTVDLSELLEITMQIATSNTDADRGTLYLLDAEAEELWSKVLQGDELKEIRLSKGKGIAWHIVETGEPMIIDDCYSHKHFCPEFDKISGYKTRNMLCVPIRNKDNEITGVIVVINKKGSNFDAKDQYFVEAIAAHASIAIETSQMASEIVRQEKLATVGQMTSFLIHDIKSPMTAIGLIAELLQKEYNDANISKYSDLIISEIKRVVNMIQEVLDYSSGGSQINLSKVSLKTFLSSIEEVMKVNCANGNITLDFPIEYKDVIVVDVFRLQRVFLNIMGNAIDAFEGIKRDEKRLAVKAEVTQDSLSFMIDDNACGIPESIKRSIFDPFVTHGKSAGTGFGLAICTRIVDLHNGSIKVESRENIGSKFTITIPRNREGIARE